MIPSLLITGSSGFLGRRVLSRLAEAHRDHVRLLLREPDSVASAFEMQSGWQFIRGTLEAPGVLEDALDGVDTVVHLASSTGKVARRVHEKVILEGTQRLVSLSQKAGVRRFLFVSSVAAGFADRRYYHYAEAKRRAEDAVRGSSMDTLIVRPTMIFGRQSAALTALRRLAPLPVPIVFGSGAAHVQPIDVDDLAAILTAAIDMTGSWHDATITVGGPEVLATETLIRRLRVSAGRAASRVVHVPIEPLRSLLASMERVLLPVLPFSAGQLTSFVNVSEAGAPGAPLPALLASMNRPLRSVEDMIADARAS